MPVTIAGITAIAAGQIMMGRDSVSDAQHRDQMD